MHLFTRTVTLMGSLPAAMAYAIDIRGYVADTVGRDVGLWSVNFGAPHGTVVFTARVEGLADLAAMNQTLLSDSGYLDRLQAGAEFRGAPGADAIAHPIEGELGDTPAPGSVAVSTVAQAAGGHFIDAHGWAVEVARHASDVGGLPVMVMTSSFGEVGRIGWLSVAPDATTADETLAKLESDERYVKMVNDAGDLFVPGSGHRSMLTCLG